MVCFLKFGSTKPIKMHMEVGLICSDIVGLDKWWLRVLGLLRKNGSLLVDFKKTSHEIKYHSYIEFWWVHNIRQKLPGLWDRDGKYGEQKDWLFPHASCQALRWWSCSSCTKCYQRTCRINMIQHLDHRLISVVRDSFSNQTSIGGCW